jgi:hypothetical protein
MKLQVDTLNHILTYIDKNINKYLSLIINKEFVNVYKSLNGTNTSIDYLFKYKNISDIKFGIESLKILSKKNKNIREKIKNLCILVTMTNNTELIKIYINKVCIFNRNFLIELAYYNNFDCFKYFNNMEKFKKCKLNDEIFTNFASNGNLEALSFLRKNNYSMNSLALKQATQNKHFNCVKFLLNNGCPIDNIISYIVLEDNFDLLKYYLENYEDKFTLYYTILYKYNLCNIAIYNNNLELLKYLHEEYGCKFDGDFDTSVYDIFYRFNIAKSREIATRYNSLKCLRYLYSCGVDLDKIY